MANIVTQIVIRARDEASSVFGSMQAKAAAVATAIAGYFGIQLFRDAVGSARAFESAMSAVQAASGATGAELAQLKAAAEEAGASTKFSSVEAANALETLAKSGLNASQAVQALPAVLNLAQAGGVGLAESADYVTKAVNGMGLSFAEAGRVADVLAMGANASSTSVEGLAGALSYAAPLASSLGLSIEQTVAILGKFADSGIDASRAGTALNAIMAQFSDPASQFRKELAAAGITTGNFDLALRQLAAAGPEGQRAINAVGTEAGPALRALLNQGIGSLDALKAKLDQSAGSAASFAKVMDDNLDGAAKGFGSAWDALLIKLGSPVLDTLKGQVNAIAERLRGFVADGTATAFGNALKAAFETGGKWAADFLSKIDFTAVAASLQAFAARMGEVFTAIGQHASTAGNTLQTAYGVMSAGINSVLAVVYKLGEGMSWLTSAFLADLATITQGLAKITFGDISAGFASAAESMRTQAQAAYSVFEAFGQKASEAFDAATQGALTAREGWDGLTTAATEAATATTSALQQAETQAGLTADQVAALGDGAVVMGDKVAQASTAAGQAAQGLAEKAQTSAAEQQQAAQATIAKVAELRAEYERAINAGDTQRATEVLIALQAELAKTGAAAKTSTADIEQAFQHLGVTSQAELDRLAAGAKRSYETIRDSGTATPRELQQAFAAYAEKAIAANDGVATSALKAEAAMRGLRIEVDASGKAVIKSMTEAAAATDKAAESATRAAGSYTQMAVAAKEAADSVGRIGPNLAQGPQRQSYEGSASSPALYILNRAERLGGLELRKQFEDGYSYRARKQGMRIASSGLADYNAYWQSVNDQLDQMQIEQERSSGRYQSNAPRVVEQQPREQIVTHRVSVGIGAGRSVSVNTASQQDASSLISLLRQLESDAMRS